MIHEDETVVAYDENEVQPTSEALTEAETATIPEESGLMDDEVAHGDDTNGSMSTSTVFEGTTTDIERISALEISNAHMSTQLAQVMEQNGQFARAFMASQQNFGNLVQAFNVLSLRVNGMDLTKPVLEVTLCKSNPNATGATEVAFKVSRHPASHPQRAGELDVLRLQPAAEDGGQPSWIEAGLSPQLDAYVKAAFDEQKIGDGEWRWVRLRETQRDLGYGQDLKAGVDETDPNGEPATPDAVAVENVQAANDDQSSSDGIVLDAADHNTQDAAETTM
jgi:hypothetical protein